MVELATSLRLTGYALGALGAALVFLEFFQVPSYVEYDTNLGFYSLDVGPNEVDEFTWLGRIGALFVALAFALLFAATLAA